MRLNVMRHRPPLLPDKAQEQHKVQVYPRCCTVSRRRPDNTLVAVQYVDSHITLQVHVKHAHARLRKAAPPHKSADEAGWGVLTGSRSPTTISAPQHRHVAAVSPLTSGAVAKIFRRSDSPQSSDWGVPVICMGNYGEYNAIWSKPESVMML